LLCVDCCVVDCVVDCVVTLCVLTGRMVVSAAGDVDHDALLKQVEQSFAKIPAKDIISPSSLPKYVCNVCVFVFCLFVRLFVC
jgi:hypothetical protein